MRKVTIVKPSIGLLVGQTEQIGLEEDAFGGQEDLESRPAVVRSQRGEITGPVAKRQKRNATDQSEQPSASGAASSAKAEDTVRIAGGKILIVKRPAFGGGQVT